MSDREINTTVVYNKNCHYNRSVQKQTTQASLIDTNLSVNITQYDNQTDFFYNDTLTITATVDNTWGTISFYFIDKNDISQQKQLINENPIPVDINGEASIQYMPYNSGSIWVEYNGDPYYADTHHEEFIVLKPRPVHIQFDDYSPYLIEEEETVIMKVTVTDEMTEELLDYGLVTFLNYSNYNEGPKNGVERVIGNPQYLINGKAHIKYSPIQLEDETSLLGNIELIRASYNYDNTAYGLTWDYYASHDDWTAIAIRRKNSINIHVPLNGDDKPLTLNDEALFTASQNEVIKLRCDICFSDYEDIEIKENNAIIFVLQDITNSSNVLYVQSTYKRDKNHNPQYYYEGQIGGSTPVPEGIYKVYAKANDITLDKGQVVPVTDLDDSFNLPEHSNNGIAIQNGLYLQSNISENFIIGIEPPTSDLTLKLTLLKKIFINTIHKNNFEVEITGLTSIEEKRALDGITFYLEILELGSKIKGFINLDKNNNRLVGTFKNPIYYLRSGKYTLRAYIEKGKYSYQENNKTIQKQYPTTYTDKEIIQVRDSELNLTLRLNIKNNIYPGKIQYIIESNNITHNDSIDVNVYIDTINDNYNSHILTQFNPTVTNFIAPQDVGSHKVIAKVVTEGYDITKEISFNIFKATLNMKMNYKSETIKSSPNTDIFLDISSEDDYNLDLLNLDNFTIQLKHLDKTQDISNDQLELLNTNDQYQLQIKSCNLYDSGEWEIIINYNNNDTYHNINDLSLKFNVTNLTPLVQKESFNENNIINTVAHIQQINQIQDEDGNIIQDIIYNNCGQHVLVLNTLSYEDNFLYFVSITDTNGQYTLKIPNNINPSEWNWYTTLEYQIVPKNDILNIFNDLKSTDDIIRNFTEYFDDYQYNDDEIKYIPMLYQQAKKNKFVTLFSMYDEITNTISLLDNQNNEEDSNEP